MNVIILHTKLICNVFVFQLKLCNKHQRAYLFLFYLNEALERIKGKNLISPGNAFETAVS